MDFYALGRQAALEKYAGGGTYQSFFTGETREDATFFPKGTMAKSTAKIVQAATNKEYAPKGIRSSISWINYYENRAGKNLKPEQKERIEAAKKILHKKLEREKKADYAPGLPEKANLGDLKKLKPGQVVDFIVQQHDAERAGKHHDVRFGNKDLGLFSWATKKELPKPGETIALFQQPVHRYAYREFEGKIPSGYGKGSVKLKDEGRILITKVSPRAVGFTRVDKKSLQRFLLVRPSPEKPWLLKNTTSTESPPFDKEHFKLVKELPSLEGAVVQPKVDGASSLIRITAPNKIELMSYRTSKLTGHPIVHTERFLHGDQELDIPKKYVGSVLRGELYGVRDGKAIPPQALGGLLNSKVEKSIADQKERGIKLKGMLFDVRRVGEKDTKGKTYEERLELLTEIMKHLPKSKFHLPEMARSREEAELMLSQIQAGKNPLTREGVVIHTPELEQTKKLKLVEEHDVFVREVFKGEGKHSAAAGGFTYSATPKGPVMGKVGAGISDELRKELWKNKADYVGRRARVQAQEKLPSGALRASVLLALHEG
jgi:hypothetical protein